MTGQKTQKKAPTEHINFYFTIYIYFIYLFKLQMGFYLVTVVLQ
jgi:hypothetical protein